MIISPSRFDAAAASNRPLPSTTSLIHEWIPDPEWWTIDGSDIITDITDNAGSIDLAKGTTGPLAVTGGVPAINGHTAANHETVGTMLATISTISQPFTLGIVYQDPIGTGSPAQQGLIGGNVTAIELRASNDSIRWESNTSITINNARSTAWVYSVVIFDGTSSEYWESGVQISAGNIGLIGLTNYNLFFNGNSSDDAPTGTLAAHMAIWNTNLVTEGILASTNSHFASVYF